MRRGPSADDIADKVIQRLARGSGSPVSPEGPDAQAVATAGFTGPAAPPPQLDTIQRSFGHHDVSETRAYIGGAAADASRALGAAAYASGDQVAFAEQPDTFLIAHELAHVVQQRGGVQLSGGVGAAGDAHERHADEVATRVVRGESAETLLDRYAAPGRTGGTAVQRYVTDATELETIAELGEGREASEMVEDAGREGGPTDAVAAMSNVGDVSAAQAEVGRIQGARPNLMTAIEERLSGFDNDLLAENEGAEDALQNYIFQAEGQTDSIATFQAQYQQLRLDFGRLDAQIQHLGGSDRGAGMRDVSGGGELGRAAVEAVGATPGATPSRSDADQNQLRNDATAAQQRMMELSRQVPGGWSSVVQSRTLVHEQVRWLASGLPVRQDTEAQQAHQRVRARVDRIAGYVTQVVSVAQQIASAYIGAGIGTAAASAVAATVGGTEAAADSSLDAIGEGVSDLAGDWESRVVEFVYLPELDQAEAEAIASTEAENRAQIQARKDAIIRADAQLRDAIRTYLTLVREFEFSKRAYREAVRNSAGPQDRTGGRREGVLGELAAESGAFLAQAQATEQIGTQLVAEGGSVSSTRRALHHGDDGPIQWNEAVSVPFVSRGGARWERRPHTVNIANMGHDTAEGDSRARDPRHRGTNATVAAAVEDIGRMRESVESFHGEVATPLGLVSRP